MKFLISFLEKNNSPSKNENGYNVEKVNFPLSGNERKKKTKIDCVFVKYRRKFISLNYRFRSIRATRVISTIEIILSLSRDLNVSWNGIRKKGKRENFTIRLEKIERGIDL